MIQHLQLLTKYGARNMSDLTSDDVSEIASALGFNLTPEKATDVTKMFAVDNVDTVTNWIGRPENLANLKEFLVSNQESEILAVKCPHCSGIFELHYDK